MASFFGYLPLSRPEDWRGLAGEDKWVPGRSAFELAHAWQTAGGLPLSVREAFDASGRKEVQGLVLDVCLVEKPVYLDTRKGPSMTDLMGYGRNADGKPVILAVEGKADERFGLPTYSWLRGDVELQSPIGEPRPSRLRRLNFLTRHLGISIPASSSLRYQLLHRTVSGLLEAALHGAEAAVMIVHAFGPFCDDNWVAFAEFLSALGGTAQRPGKVVGPFLLGEKGAMPTFFLWCQDCITPH